MNSVPAMSATSVNLPPPVASASAQTSAPGSLSKFQDVYQNLPSMQDQSHQDGQPADSKNALLKKKPVSGDGASVTAVTSGTWNNASLPSAPLTLALSLGLAPQPARTPSQEPETVSAHTPGPAPESAQGPELAAKLLNASAGPALEHGQSPIQNSIPQSVSTQAAREALHLPSVASSPATGMSSAAVMSVADSNDSRPRAQSTHGTTLAATPASSLNPSPVGNALPSASLPNTLPEAIEQTNGTLAKSAPESPAAPAGTVTSGAFPLSAENLAFAMQLAQGNDKPTTPAAPAVAATPISAIRPELLAQGAPLPPPESKPQTPLVPSTPPSAAPLRSLTAVQVTPGGGRPSAHSDSPSHDTFGNSESSARDSSNLEKPETAPHAQVTGGSQSPAPAAILNHSPGALAQPGPDGTAWLGAGTHVDTRPSMNLTDQPAPAAPPVAALSELQPLNVAPPRLNPSNEILLNLGNGQSSAAVRLVDRAGTISVSVHASDQDLRNSLRSNLSDLTTQLNAQGVKTEVLKTVSAQPAPESRPDPGGQQQRSSGQPHSLFQNDRQSQRDRRANNQWLDELAEQASASTLQPGGKNS